MIEKVSKKKIKKQVKENLFYSGAFDCWNARDSWHLDEEANRISGPLDEIERREKEKQAIGFSLSFKDNISKFKEMINERITENLENTEDEDDVLVAGELIDLKTIKTRSGQPMAFATLSYFNEDYSLTIFPREYTRYQHLLNSENILLALGSWDKERETVITKNLCLAEQLYKELNNASRC